MLWNLAKTLALMLVVAAPIASGLFRVWVHNDAVQTGYLLSDAEAQRTKLIRLRQELEVELAAEKSPERLMALARKLGMSPARPDQLLGAPHSGGRTR